MTPDVLIMLWNHYICIYNNREQEEAGITRAGVYNMLPLAAKRVNEVEEKKRFNQKRSGKNQ